MPATCAKLADQTKCKALGDVVRFDPVWGPKTPAGSGVEVVLDQRGCVVRTTARRGTALTPGQTSIQATGSGSAVLLSLARGGCLTASVQLFANGEQVQGTRGMQAVTDNKVLVDDGRNRYPQLPGDAAVRNPETAVGATEDGKILLVTVDGRRTGSVGVNSPELAAVMTSLGAANAVQLDGGGSTDMVANGKVVNSPSDGAERVVGDALVWVL